jgi:hypothetical protein
VQPEEAPKPRVKRKAAPAVSSARKASSRRIEVRAPKAAPAKGPSCGKCGRSGHNARTCGKASAKPASDDEEEGDAPAPPRLDREDRALAIREAMAERGRLAAAPPRRGRPRKGEERPVVDPDAAVDLVDDEPRTNTDEIRLALPGLKSFEL